MNNKENQLNYLIPDNKDNSIWDYTLFADFSFETANIQDYINEKERLEKELSKLQERIDQEIALTEKITSSIKSKSSNPHKDLNAIKDIEIQWRTAQVNIDNIKKLVVPKEARIKELDEKIRIEKINSIENVRNTFLDKIANEIEITEEQINFIKDKIQLIYSIHKALIEIEKERPKINGIDDIIPIPVDSFDIFYNSITEYIDKLKNQIQR